MNNQPDLGQFANEVPKVMCCSVAEGVMPVPVDNPRESAHGPGQEGDAAELDQELLECTEQILLGFSRDWCAGILTPSSWACAYHSMAQA